jgi:hypothetical protein
MNNRFKSALSLGLSTIAATAITTLTPSARANDNFNNNFIRFGKDTLVEFEVTETHGAYQSTFGVINLVTGEKTPLLAEVKASDDPSLVSPRSRDFIGTPGNTIPQPLASYTFKAGQPYAFYMDNVYQGREAGTVYSSNNRNIGGQLQSRVGDIGGLSSQGLKIDWEDTTPAGGVIARRGDKDYNDFTIIAGGNAGKSCRIRK